MTEVFAHRWGAGTPVVLVHGALATGDEEWAAQQPLADEGFRLLALDRRGYGRSAAADGEDYVRDGEDIARVLDDLGEPAHVVGHSYGGLGAMVAAAHRPGSTRSLALLEPPVWTLAQQDPAAQEMVTAIRHLWNQDLSDEAWLRRFLEAVGTDLESLPPAIVEEAAPLVPLVRRSRPPWEGELPVRDLAGAEFPKLVVSGGHHPGWDAICDALARETGAARAEIPGAGHEIQFTGAPVNRALRELWCSTP